MCNCKYNTLKLNNIDLFTDEKPAFDVYHKCNNKAIRDGKYLAPHMPVLGNVHPIKIENLDIFS